MPKKIKNIYKWFLTDQYLFDLTFTCWANNHNGRSKAKKYNKKLAKRRERRNWRKEIENED